MFARPASFAAAPQRLDALSDGVFAIVLTLLALELRLPDAEKDRGFLAVFLANAGVLENFLVSFLVVGILWRLQHMVSDHLPRGVPYANALTLLFLATVTLTPWSLDNLTSFPGDPMAVATFSGILLASWSLLIAMLSLSLGVLGTDDERRLRVRQIRLSLLSGPAVAVASIVLAPLSTTAALYAWLLLVPLNIAIRKRFAAVDQ